MGKCGGRVWTVKEAEVGTRREDGGRQGELADWRVQLGFEGFWVWGLVRRRKMTMGEKRWEVGDLGRGIGGQRN